MTTNRRRAVLRDVAELASVSIKTASRVLNDDPAVAEPTRAAVVRAMEALDYQPDPAARSLRAGKDRMVGVVIDSVGDVFFSRMVARIESVLNAAGYLALIASSNRNEQAERDVVQAFVQRRCAGIIVAPITPASLHGLGLRDTPIVFVDRIGDLPQTPSVVSDDYGFGWRAAEHLIRHGHRRIALISDTPSLATTRLRQDGFRAAMTAGNLPIDERHMQTNCEERGEVLRAINYLLHLDQPPTALISTNTRLSLGVVPALHQYRRTDVGLISIGDFDMAASLSPGVTVIDHSPEALGEEASTTLLRQLSQSGAAPQETLITVPAQLIPRGSGEVLMGSLASHGLNEEDPGESMSTTTQHSVGALAHTPLRGDVS